MHEILSSIPRLSQRPARLTPEFAQREYDRLHSEIAYAESAPEAEKWIGLLNRWDALRSYRLGTSRVRYKYSGHLLDKELENADTFMREKITPVLEKNGHLMNVAVMKTRHRETLVQKFGDQLFNRLETFVKPLDPRLADLRLEESRLANDFRRILGTAETIFRGEKYTLTGIQKFRTSPDADFAPRSFSPIVTGF